MGKVNGHPHAAKIKDKILQTPSKDTPSSKLPRHLICFFSHRPQSNSVEKHLVFFFLGPIAPQPT
jgi:hypothetical protein